MSVAGSDLVSVIGSHPDDLKEWTPMMVRNDRALARLHAKFWGKSMAEEQLEWHITRPADPTAKGEIGDEDQQMSIDVESMDNDIASGCYILNFDISGLDMSKIWVRADYIRIYDFLETRHNVPTYEHRAPGAVITGQPGIGKSIWLYYALRRRLAERKPVIWFREQSCYLFVEEGVYEVPRGFKPSYFHVFIWTLVDSDEAKQGIPPHLVSRGTRLFVIFSTSPCSERWSHLHQTVRDITIIMNPWTRKEISYAASIYSPELIDHHRANRAYDLLGPTPRLCIDFVLDPLKLAQYEDGIRRVVLNITINELEQRFKDASSLTLDAVPHQIFLIRRENRENIASPPIVKVITSSMQSRLASQFRTLERHTQIRLHNYFAKVPDLTGIAGVFFEAAGQRRLQDGMELKLIPMVYSPPTRTIPRPQWYSSHVLLRDDTLEASRQQALRQALRIHVKALQYIEYEVESGPSFIQPDTFYVPALSNQVGLDCFILVNGFLVIFQFMIGENHDIRPGLIDFLATRPFLPSRDKWLFVFLIPPNWILVCPQLYGLEMRKLLPYSAVINF